MRFDSSIVQARHTSPLGPVTMAATREGLAGVWFDGQRHMPETAGWPLGERHPVLERAARQLDEYFAGQAVTFDVPLDLRAGTAFQQRVWQALMAIPRGATCSYRWLSDRIGQPAAVRAVGAAVGRNPVSIIVPCHRILGADGSLTGYAGGLERKSALLRLEATG